MAEVGAALSAGESRLALDVNLNSEKLMAYEIVSPNNWIIRAGGHLSENDKLIQPMKCVLMPMHHASTSIEKYRKEKDLPQTMDLVGKMQLIQNIGLNVRTADKAYFNEWSNAIIQNGLNSSEVIKLFEGCKNCFKKSFSGNSLREFVSPRLKELSDLNNEKIIHTMDSGKLIDNQDFQVVFDYYDEFIQLNLLSFPALKDLPKKKCKECIKLTSVSTCPQKALLLSSQHFLGASYTCR